MRTIALVGLLTGCSLTIPDGAEPIDCTADERISVTVTLTGETGERVVEADVWFTTPSGVEQACESWDNGHYACGFEVAGPMTVHADAWGYEPVQVDLDIAADECHVLTEQIELVMPLVRCDQVERYAVEVLPVNVQGQTVLDARVEAMPYGENWTFPEPCERVSDGPAFSCGLGWGGEIEIWASSRRQGSFYDIVDVPFDECGPIETVSVTATLTR